MIMLISEIVVTKVDGTFHGNKAYRSLWQTPAGKKWVGSIHTDARNGKCDHIRNAQAVLLDMFVPVY